MDSGFYHIPLIGFCLLSLAACSGAPIVSANIVAPPEPPNVTLDLEVTPETEQIPPPISDPEPTDQTDPEVVPENEETSPPSSNPEPENNSEPSGPVDYTPIASRAGSSIVLTGHLRSELFIRQNASSNFFAPYQRSVEDVEITLTVDSGIIEYDAADYSHKDTVSTTGFLGEGLENYEYLRLATEFRASFDGAPLNSDLRVTSIAIAGIQTGIDDMPLVGTATYNGSGQFGLRTSSNIQNLVGSVLAQADFEAGNLTVIFDAQNDSGVFDKVVLDNISIVGAQLEGANVVLSKSGNEFDPIGANQTTQISGGFFGLDPETQTPDELGAVLDIAGDDGALVGGFIAD